jgi:hypothetical protein
MHRACQPMLRASYPGIYQCIYTCCMFEWHFNKKGTH